MEKLADMKSIKRLNIKLSQESEEDNKFLDSLVQGFGDGIGSKAKLKAKIKETLDPSRAADILAYQEAREKNVRYDPNEFAEFIWQKDLLTKDELLEYLPTDQEYKFLEEVKENKKSFNELVKDHQISDVTLTSLYERKFLISLSEADKDEISNNQTNFTKFKDFRKKGLVSYLSDSEQRFFSNLEPLNENDLCEKAEKIGLSINELRNLKKNGQLDFISDDERAVLTAYTHKDPALEDLITSKKVSRERISSRISFENESGDLSVRVNDARHKVISDSPVCNYFEPYVIQAKRDGFSDISIRDLNLMRSSYEGNETDRNKMYRIDFINKMMKTEPQDTAKKIAGLIDPRELSSYLETRLNQENENGSLQNYLKAYLDELPPQKIIEFLPSASELAFLSRLRGEGLEFPDAENLSKNYQADIQSLKSRGLIQHYNKEYEPFLSSLENEKNIESVSDVIEFAEKKQIPKNEIKKLINDGVIRALSSNESRFISDIKLQLDGKIEPDVEAMAKKYLINEKRLNLLKSYGIIDYSSGSEKEYLCALREGNSELASEIAKVFSTNDLIGLKKRISFFSPSEVKSIDTVGYPSKIEVAYLNTFKEISNGSESDTTKKDRLKQLNESSGFDKRDLHRLKNRINFYSGHEVKSVDLLTKVNGSLCIDRKIRSRYKEADSILNLRKGQRLDHKVTLTKEDHYLLMHNTIKSKENLSYANKVRRMELSLSDKKTDSKYILSNNEKVFISNLSRRNFNKNPATDIINTISSDYGVGEDRASFLLEKGIIGIENKSKKSRPVFKVSINYREPAELSQARVWLNSDEQTKKNIETPASSTLSLLKEKSEKFRLKPELSDYNLYFKVKRSELLSSRDRKRIGLLNENGTHLDSKEYQKWIHSEPKSFQMKGARKNAFLIHYEKEYGFSREALDWTNRFKQLSENHLKKFMGITSEEIDRYTKGVKGKSGDYTGKFPLLVEHREFTKDGAIKFYTLAHNGPISGRGFMEKYIPKEKISKYGQTRQELIHHDLKVVDCVWQVKKELEGKNKKILNIKNEATQYGDEKRGVSNEDRKNGPGFMDAAIIIDEQVPTKGGGERSKIVAVEYGNYSVSRMAEKIYSSDFDEAHIFADAQHINKYITHIGYVPGVRYRII